MITYIYERFAHLVGWDSAQLNTKKLEEYAAAIYSKGASLDCAAGSIDGTLREICWPKKNQRVVYSGHKRKHGLKYQSIVAPDGIILHMFGLIAGSHHDSYVLLESKILQKLVVQLKRNGHQFFLYGDTAYGIPLCALYLETF